MSVGQGSLGIENKNSGGAGAANNGLSVSGGATVLGNDVGAAGDPAALLSDREIISDAFGITLKELITGQDITATLKAFFFQIINNASTVSVSLSALGAALIDLTDAVTNKPKIRLALQGGHVHGCIQNNDGVIEIGSDPLLSAALFIDMITQHMRFTGTMGTVDPGSGAGKWALGKKIAAAVALDPAHYIETQIDGVTVKLAIVT